MFDRFWILIYVGRGILNREEAYSNFDSERRVLLGSLIERVLDRDFTVLDNDSTVDVSGSFFFFSISQGFFLIEISGKPLKH